MRQPKEVVQQPPQSPQPLSHWWRHGTLLVMMFGFTVLTVVTVLTYTNAPPIPMKVFDPAGGLLFTGDDIERGQEVFLKHALMEHGTLWGHGAYLGPDYTAEYLHREVGVARDVLATARFSRPSSAGEILRGRRCSSTSSSGRWCWWWAGASSASSWE
ncbi:MAG TPA: hypothetical protein VF341_03195 [Anaeromyxobacteraceae bacterium]